MRIIGQMIVGPGERWLCPVLEQKSKLVDDMIIVGNRVDKKTEVLIKSFDPWYYRDDREWGLYQPDIKQDLLAKTAKLKPDWILPSDADEFYDKYFTREEAERLVETDVLGYNFAVVNLWNDESHYRHDLSFWNIRFWNYNLTKEISLKFARKRVHCGLAPEIVYKYGSHAPFLLKHYGLMRPEDRKRKVKRYEKYDPHAKFKSRQYYDALKNEQFVRVFNEDSMHQRVAEDSQKHGYNYGKNV